MRLTPVSDVDMEEGIPSKVLDESLAEGVRAAEVAQAYEDLDKAPRTRSKVRLDVSGDGDCQWGSLVRAMRTQGYPSPSRLSLKRLCHDWIAEHMELYGEWIRAEHADVEGTNEEGVNAFLEGLTKPVSEGSSEPSLLGGGFEPK